MTETFSDRAYDYPEPSAFVVDDEPQIRAFVSNVLATAGFRPFHIPCSFHTWHNESRCVLAWP